MVITDKQIPIVYMGTPDFAVAPLKLLIDSGYNVVAVVTAPDKPAGRGQITKKSAVKVYAESINLAVLQPTNLKDDNFFDELNAYNAQIFIVVAFRMLPQKIWQMPSLGTFNLHASLLPQYRGAAPINWAIINGETKTGVTTFFIDDKIDTGNIIFAQEVEIDDNDNFEILHNKLMDIGAQLVVKTVDAIALGNVQTQQQKESADIKQAPKIFKENCKINWQQSPQQIYNLIRGLSPYPAAWCQFEAKNKQITTAKIYDATFENNQHSSEPGTIKSDDKSFLKIACNGGFIKITDIHLAGKKRLKIKEFLAGFRNAEDYMAK